jgi:hypothetical protein
MSLLARLVLGAVMVLFASALPASAGQPVGSAAWVDDGWLNDDGALYRGPGPEYGEIGTVGGGLRIRVSRCSGLWCEIRAKNLHGWMLQQNISFGQYPWHLFDGRQRNPIRYGATVCFFSGANYRGTESCFHSNTVVHDLLLIGLDNSFASVQVNGGSVMACRDRNFRSYCVILNKDIPSLEKLLNKAISSIRVY